MPEVISLFSDSSSDDDFYDNFDKIKLKAAQKKRKQSSTSPILNVRNVGAVSSNLGEEILCVEDLATLTPQDQTVSKKNLTNSIINFSSQIIKINDGFENYSPSCSKPIEIITLAPDAPAILKKNSKICRNIPHSFGNDCTISIHSNGSTRMFIQDLDDPIKNLIEEYAERVNSDPKKIVLITKKLKRCALEDTPRTLGIICGENADLDAFEHTDVASLNLNDELKTIRIKYQQKGKRTIISNILKTAKFVRLKEIFCQENALSLNKVQFIFDSVKIGDNETAETLELEDDDCIDVYILD